MFICMFVEAPYLLISHEENDAKGKRVSFSHDRFEEEKPRSSRLESV